MSVQAEIDGVARSIAAARAAGDEPRAVALEARVERLHARHAPFAQRPTEPEIEAEPVSDR